MAAARFDEAGDATRRTRLATERTYLAWWRTGLTCLAVGFGAGRLVPDLSQGTNWPFEVIGVAFALVGVGFIVYGYVRQKQVEEGKVVGVLTDRDIVSRSTCEERSPLSSKVYDVMTPTAIWCYEDEMLTDAAQLLAGHHIRRLLVFDLHKKLVGLLSLDDLAARMSSDRLLGNVLRRVTAAPVSENDQTFERVGRT